MVDGLGGGSGRKRGPIAPAPARLAGAPLAAMLLLLATVLGGCQWALGAGRPPGQARQAALALALPAHWVPYRHVGTVVDLTVARADGRLTVAAYGHLLLLQAGGALTPFARGPGGYSTTPGAESYLTLVPGGPVPGAGCSFAADSVFALQVRNAPGVVEVTSGGKAHRFASLPGTIPGGIAFDDVGRFEHRLLVTSAVDGRTSLFGIDCAGRVTTISARLPRVEGGITVAPLSFGAYGGDLIATDEVTGRIWAFSPSGRAALVARPGLPAGQDIGVESTGFVPQGFGLGWAAYVADRFTINDVAQPPPIAVRRESNCVTVLPAPCRHVGTGDILRLAPAVLTRAGARPGDLLVATEAGARTILVHCATTCTVRGIADGPAVTNAEGHIVFARLG